MFPKTFDPSQMDKEDVYLLDKADEFGLTYYTSYFCSLVGSGIKLSALVIYVPTKFVLYDCMLNGFFLALHLMRCEDDQADPEVNEYDSKFGVYKVGPAPTEIVDNENDPPNYRY
jgi:hypothetical protein